MKTSIPQDEWSTHARSLITVRPRNRLLLAAACAAALCLWGCKMDQYSGDGTFKDNGSSSATDRYVVDLGEVNIGVTAKNTFRLTGLPSSNYVVGFRVAPDATGTSDSQDTRPNPIISIKLGEIKAERIVKATLPLRQWTWSEPSIGRGAFVYLAGPTGSYFSAGRGRGYLLEIEVVHPDQSTGSRRVTLVVKSGGWK